METQGEQEILTVRGWRPFPFMPWKWPFIIFSIVCFTLSVYEIAFRGFNFGVDFLGGTKLVYEFDASVTSLDIREATDGLGIGEVQIVPFGDGTENRYIIRAKYAEGQDTAKMFDARFAEAMGEGKARFLGSEVVGPKVGLDLRRKGIISLLMTCALILVYVGFRFDFLFAPGAVVALVHDVVISAGIFAWFGKEFNLPILAALLTILGYSINDTIVIYDRIRENVKGLPHHASLEKIIDVSLTETFSRTIVTSLTVFIVALTMFFMGGAVLHDFSFCLIVGLVFGSYSSLFVASPVYVWLQRLFPTQGMNRLRLAQESPPRRNLAPRAA